MKKVLAGLGGLTLLTFLYLPATPSAEVAAVVVKDSACMLLDGDGGIVLGTDSITVINSGGGTMFRCSVKDVPNSTGRAARFDAESTGMPCGTAAGMTTDWHETVSASGHATLTCRVKK